MLTSYTRVNLRPIRLAMLVDPCDSEAFRRALEINTCVWGGIRNPIILTYHRRPKSYKNHYGNDITYGDIVNYFLMVYDPDYLVQCSNNLPTYLPDKGLDIIKPEDITKNLLKNFDSSYSINIFNIFQDFDKQEMKFIRNAPIDFFVPSEKITDSLFNSAVFGAWPSKVKNILNEYFFSKWGVSESNFEKNNYLHFYQPNWYLPIDFTKRHIKRGMYRGGANRRGFIMLIEPTNIVDIVDFWNMRAMGFLILPVVSNLTYSDSENNIIKDFFSVFKKGVSKPDEPEFGRKYNIEVIKGRSIPKSVFSVFVEHITSLTGNGKANFYISEWLPHDESGMRRGPREIPNYSFNCKKIEYSTSSTDNRVELRQLAPGFMDKYGGEGHPRFANDFNISIFSERGPLAEVFPLDKPLQISSFFRTFWNWRISRAGITHLAAYEFNEQYLEFPSSEEVMKSYLREHGFTIEISAAGKTANNLLEKLGGKWGRMTISNEKVLRLLNSLSGDKTISYDHLVGQLKKATNDTEFGRPNHEILLKRLLNANALQLGLKVQCSYCTQKSWFPLDTLGYNNYCPKCLEKFDLPTQKPSKMKWEYKPIGPFNLPNSGYGSFSVVLTYFFFSVVMKGTSSPLMSFIASKDNGQYEVDLGLLYREDGLGDGPVYTIWAECKTYNEIEQKDVNRMKEFAKYFPGCVIVFSTLKDKLNARERKILLPLAKKFSKTATTKEASPSLMILTGNELFAEGSLRSTWEKLGGMHKKLSRVHMGYNKDMYHFCASSQCLYLGYEHPEYKWVFKRNTP